MNFLPRIMRPAEAAYYCGMGRTTFERDIRPNVPEIAIGRQGVGFDRLDLDHALDDYKQRNLKPCHHQEEPSAWQQPKPNSQACTGTKLHNKAASTNVSPESGAFDIALQQARGRKPKPNTTKPSKQQV